MSEQNQFNELLEAGAHFGHMRSKWNPAMAPYIFSEKNGIHIIDLNKTVAKIDEAAQALKHIARSGRKILFVATKKQAKDIVAEKVKPAGMPYVTERWPGGMLTNFATIRKSVRRMSQIDKMFADGTFSNISKRERLQYSRERAKLEVQFGSIADLSRLPAALFIVDIVKEHIAVAEARRLNIPTFAIVDTNADPNAVNYAIPANDDASTSVSYIVGLMVNAIQEGLSDRKLDKDMQDEAERDNESKTMSNTDSVEEESENVTTGSEVKKTRKRTIKK
ncbi:MAG: ribosomal protein [Bacteroidota bacterium]|jgi:small subunit ribosomal protein S2|nr:30S ribosomal protein S2 [Bacteroidia bacterium]NBY10927.1 30S ribosomal protein S2 [Sphingobacteriia bacterium]